MAVHIPEDVVAAIELQLWSEVEGKVPFGAWAKLLEKLLREHLARTNPAVLRGGWGGPGPVGDGG